MSDQHTTQAPPARQQLSGGQKRRLRRLLLWGGPLLVALVTGFLYITGGRYVSTENAYIKANKVSVSTQVAGPIDRVEVHENEPVRKGQLLFRIDQHPYQLSVDRARARLLEALGELESLRAKYHQKKQEMELAATRLAHARRNLEREKALANRDLSSRSKLDDLKFRVDEARQQRQVLQKALKEILARLGDPNIDVKDHPLYHEAEAQLKKAKLDLAHTEVTAPFSGIASQTPESGSYARPGQPVMAIVSADKLWITANFKETDITHMEAGQPVTIHVDSYPGHAWKGHVQSISQASGAEFSVLPPQNATGNWVKVVQRIPVRIAVDSTGPQLRAGMSTEVKVDTGRYGRLPGFLGPVAAWFDGEKLTDKRKG